MSRPRKFTKHSFTEAVFDYFMSIRREVPVMEEVPTGELDKMGHPVKQRVPVFNQKGEPAFVLDYFVPPTVGGLCAHLGIHRSTWAEYCDPQLYPEFQEPIQYAKDQIRAYLDLELLRRKDVRGIIFDLQANHGLSERSATESAPVVRVELSDAVRDLAK